MLVRHRIDLAKLYLGKDGGYTLRKFKRIFKREMEERPELYEMVGKGQKRSTPIPAEDFDDLVDELGAQDMEDEEPEEGAENEIDEDAVREEDREKSKAQFKKELEEMNADSEDETYNFDEDEMEELLEKVENSVFATEEDAIKYFEEYYEKIKAKRLKLNRFRVRKPDTRDKYDKIFDEDKEIRSKVGDEWVLDTDTAKRFYKDLDNNLCRYPHGFRHYESFANYKLSQPHLVIQDYITEMNSQVEFE